jgi:hypothetical protein
MFLPPLFDIFLMKFGDCFAYLFLPVCHYLFSCFFPSLPPPPLPSHFCISQTACFYGLQRGLYEVLQEPDKIGDVRITYHWGAFARLSLPWENNTHYELSAYVCNLSYPARNAHAPYCHLWPVRLYRIFSHYIINGTILGGGGDGKVIEHKTVTELSVVTIWWGKFSQKHNYKYMAKLCYLLAMENYMFRPIEAICWFWQLSC